MKTAMDCKGRTLAIGDRVRVLEFVQLYGREGASIRTVEDISDGSRFPELNYVKVTGVLGFANGTRFEKVTS